MRSAPAKLILTCAFALALLALPQSAEATGRYQAHLQPNGKAVAPKGAPPEVKQMIRAANRIRDKKYVWGGGHGSWNDKGYDCSGAVSFVLHRAGLLDYPLASGGFEKWGKGGESKWFTLYANEGHVFAIIAGLRWDTSYITDGDKSGPGWSETMRSTKGFKERKPAGVRHW